jgi:hypothetical protein
VSLASRLLRPLSDSEQVKPSPAAKLSLNDIFIRCPHTLAPLATGLDIRWVVFDSLPAVGVLLRCPSCGQIHKWKPRDTWIGSRDVNFRKLNSERVAQGHNVSC